jgi:hypothetical protein
MLELTTAVKAMRKAQKEFYSSVPGSETRRQWLAEAKKRETAVDRILTELDNKQPKLF